MAGPAGADFLVTRIFHISSGITGFNRLHAFDLIINGLQTPETTPG
jgi:hypothetical protein